MKVIVASKFKLDSNFANAINVIKIADGFASLGHDVTLFCRRPKDRNFSFSKFRERYLLNKNIEIKCYPYFKFLFLIDDYFFCFQVFLDIFFIKPNFVYARDYILPLITSLMRFDTIVESHAHINNNSIQLKLMIWGLKNLKYLRHLITISDVLRRNFILKGVPDNKVAILYDSVDLKLFNRPKNLKNVINKRFTILYSGSLYAYKGIYTILGAARLLPEVDINLLGGNDKEIKEIKDEIQKNKLKNVYLLGFVDLSKVPNYLFNADLLLLPPTNNHPSSQWTSPIKMGEYFASKTPVVASNIPALLNLINNDEVFFFEAGSSQSLAETIIYAMSNKKAAKKKSLKAFKKAQLMSYEYKCQRMIGLVSS